MSDIENLRYPKELVHRYGAKAGILLYVAEELPDIPQMPMVVSKIGESPRDFLKRADEGGIGWPRLFRSSAVVELLGYEGDFPTTEIDIRRKYKIDPPYVIVNGDYIVLREDTDIDTELEKEVERISKSPQELSRRYNDLPSEINVIATEVAPSKYRGTLIQHPHNPDMFVATTLLREDEEYKTTHIFTKSEGFEVFETPYAYPPLDFTNNLYDELEQVIDWHNVIANLPEMDQGWAWQIEYGLDPVRLFQVRPFLEKKQAAFRLGDGKRVKNDPIVFGITPQQGINFAMWSSFDRGFTPSDLPSLLVTGLREASGDNRDEQFQALFLQKGGGLLEHGDVKLIRASQLTVVYPVFYHHENGGYGGGGIVNVVSDGNHTKVTQL